MQSSFDITETFLASLYFFFITIAGYLGWIVVKLFKAITPKASSIVEEMAKRWVAKSVNSELTPIIDRLTHLEKSVDKIKKATHDKQGMEKTVLSRLVDVADQLEKKLEEIYDKKDKS